MSVKQRYMHQIRAIAQAHSKRNIPEPLQLVYDLHQLRKTHRNISLMFNFDMQSVVQNIHNYEAADTVMQALIGAGILDRAEFALYVSTRNRSVVKFKSLSELDTAPCVCVLQNYKGFKVCEKCLNSGFRKIYTLPTDEDKFNTEVLGEGFVDDIEFKDTGFSTPKPMQVLRRKNAPWRM